MGFALVLSGGKGVRLGNIIPKQYLEISNKPIIGYCLDTFQSNDNIDGIYIVLDDHWKNYVLSYIEENNISKFKGFASSGVSRSHSILNGLSEMKSHDLLYNSIVIIHDAARPNVSHEIINNCIDKLSEYDCSMPVIPVKDTIYVSNDSKTISSLLNRDLLCAGQAPEAIHLDQYLNIMKKLSDDELASISGTSALAFEYGLTVGLFPGNESNYKITTIEDLNKFKQEMEL